MKRALILLALVGCSADDAPPSWSLDRDRIVAVRANPPALLPGDVGLVEILVAHAGGPTAVEVPKQASAPGPLFTAVHFNLDHWQIDGPDEAQLAAARAELGLPDGAPVPLDLELIAPGPLYATKRMLLGTTAENPALPEVTIGDHPPTPQLELFAGREVPLLIEAPSVHWFTSCGELHDETTTRAMLVLDEECTGELVVVVRDGVLGVTWSVWPLHVSR